MVAAEALAVETPVVAFDIPCLRELVGSDVGAIVPEGDVDALAKAVRELSVDPSQRAVLGAAGKAKVAHLTWDHIAEAQGSVYREMTRNQPYESATKAGVPLGPSRELNGSTASSRCLQAAQLLSTKQVAPGSSPGQAIPAEIRKYTARPTAECRSNAWLWLQ